LHAQWVASSAELPHEGQPVEFLLDGRDVAMGGTYIGQTFRSHWTEYDVGRVRNWRIPTPPASAAFA